MPISGWCFKAEGQLTDALVWLKKAVELEPENADFWQWLAELYDEMEEPGESIPCWERVVGLDPDRPSAHLSLGWALQDEGRLAEAREQYDTAIQLQPEYRRRLFEPGRAAGRAGRPGGGRRSVPDRLTETAHLCAAARPAGDAAARQAARTRPGGPRGAVDR